MGYDPAQNLAVDQVVHEGLALEVEDSRTKVRSVGGLLAAEEAHADFRPIGVAGHSDEEVRNLLLGSNGEGVLTGLVHVTGATNEGGRENDTLTDGASVVVPAIDCVGESTVLRRSEFVLVRPDVRKAGVLDASVHVNDPFLEEAAILEEEGFVETASHEAVRCVGSHANFLIFPPCPLCNSHPGRSMVFHAQAVSGRTGRKEQRVPEGLDMRGEVVEELEVAVNGFHADVSVVRGHVGRSPRDRFGDKRCDFCVGCWEVVPTGVVLTGGCDKVEGVVGKGRGR